MAKIEVEQASETAEVVAQTLEQLADGVRAGQVNAFRVKWKGGDACKLETKLDLNAIAAAGPENEEDDDDAISGSN